MQEGLPWRCSGREPACQGRAQFPVPGKSHVPWSDQPHQPPACGSEDPVQPRTVQTMCKREAGEALLEESVASDAAELD